MFGKSTGPPGGRSGTYHDGGSRLRRILESRTVAPLKIFESSDGVLKTQWLYAIECVERRKMWSFGPRGLSWESSRAGKTHVPKFVTDSPPPSTLLSTTDSSRPGSNDVNEHCVCGVSRYSSETGECPVTFFQPTVGSYSCLKSFTATDLACLFHI